MMTKVEALQKANLYLASLCDGAIEIDNQGFNGVDSHFGKSLAEQKSWTEKQALAARKMLKKYRGQLERAGFDTQELFNNEEIVTSKPEIKKEEKITKTKNTAKFLENNRIEIWFEFDWNILELVKSLKGRRFESDKRGKYWTVPVALDTIETLEKADFVLCEKLQEIKMMMQKPKKTVEEMKEVEINGLKIELFPFQKKGVAFIEHNNGRALIGDEMGLGKTIQALAWMALHPEKRPAIILCPAHLKLNWEKEIYKTLPGNAKVQVLQGTTIRAIVEDIIIINYDILNAWLPALQKIKPQILIMDEAHYIKSNSAIRTKTTKKLAKKIPHVIALTGTPIINRPVEGFNIVQVINNTIFPNFWEYVHTYCDARHNGFGWDFSGASNKEELHKKLIETVMIRRKKSEVLPDMPDKLRSFVPMEMSNVEKYNKAEQDFINYLKETKGDDAARKAGQAEHLVKVGHLKQLAIEGKMDQAIEWIQSFIENSNGDGKLVVFAVHKKTITKLMDKFKKVAVKVDGSVSSEKRNEAVEKFQNDPTIKLFIGNIQAAGTGLTLTAASSVAFLELPWTPGELLQAEDRCHRIGQKNTVNIYYLLANKTIEEDIADLLDKKRKVLEAVLDGKQVEETQLLTELIKKYYQEEEM